MQNFLDQGLNLYPLQRKLGVLVTEPPEKPLNHHFLVSSQFLLFSLEWSYIFGRLKEKKPFGFVLENVEGLVNHDKENPKDKIGRTLTTILQHLDALGYHVNWKVLNAKNFEVPQDRKRIYIVGTKKEKPSLENFAVKHKKLGDVLETGLPVSNSRFTELLLSHYTVEELYGKSIKDKRGGDNNIHSWDIEYKGAISSRQIELLNKMLKERRKKKWAEI